MEAKVQFIPLMRVACVRHVGPYQECAAAWNTLTSWAGPKGLITPETVFLGLSYDDPDTVPPDQLRYDACITVGPEAQAEGAVDIREIAGRDYAVTVHRGPYEELYQVYTDLYGEWIPTNGYTYLEEPAVEIYRNTPETTPPEDLITEVCAPVMLV